MDFKPDYDERARLYTVAMDIRAEGHKLLADMYFAKMRRPLSNVINCNRNSLCDQAKNRNGDNLSTAPTWQILERFPDSILTILGGKCARCLLTHMCRTTRSHPVR